jgi:hypothetical protein
VHEKDPAPPAAGPSRLARPAWVLSSLAAALLVGTALLYVRPRPAGDPSREDLVRGTEIQLVSPNGRVTRETAFVWSSPVRADHFKLVVLDTSNAVVFAGKARAERLELGGELWSSLVPLQPYTWSVEAFDEDDRALAASLDQTFTYAPER